MKMKPTATLGAISRVLSFFRFTVLLLASGVAVADHTPFSPDAMILEGIMGAVYGDPMAGSGQQAQKFFTLTTDDGRHYALDFAHAALPPEGVPALYRKRIQVRATQPLAPFSSDGSIPPLAVETVRVLADPEPAAITKTTGTLPYVSLLCKFSDDLATEPRTPSYFTTQLGNASPGFGHYFNEASYGTISLNGSATTSGWVSLGHPRNYYIDGVRQANDTNSGATPGYLRMIFNDCTAVHNAAVNYPSYFGINIMLNGQLEGAAWGGCMTGNLDGTNKCWPTTWMPFHGATAACPLCNSRFGWGEHGVLAHELSHSFGAPHSDDPNGYEYGSSWDVVSNPGASCATIDGSYGCLAQHMNTYAKTVMGTIGAGRMATHAVGSTQTYNIERLAQPGNAGSTYQMVKVSISGTSSRYYTVESRFRIGYDAQLYGDGVIIHEVDTLRSTGNPARLVAPGGSTAAGYGGMAAAWQPGMTFVSATNNVRIDINSVSGTGTANVTVGPYVAVVDLFPPSCAIPAGWTTPAGATTGWSASTDSAAIGNCSLKSNTLATPSGSTINKAQIQYTGSFAAGNITFWARVSAEATYDCLRFLIDGTQQNVGSCSGVGGMGGLGLTPPNYRQPDTGWRFFSIPITAGTHTVTWSYDKDSYAAGLDAAWIDSVTFPTSASGADLAITHTVSTNPASSGKDAVFSLSAANSGPLTASNVVISTTYDPTATLIWLSPGCAGAGGTTLTCAVGTLASGASSPTFKVVLRKNVAGTLSNNASVASATADTNAANNTSNLNITVNASTPGVPVTRYRLYSPISLEHHFTTDLNEYNTLGTFVGAWIKEGAVGKVLNNPGSYNGVAAVPYYRLYDNSTNWHHWTTDANEYYTLSLYPWWSAEGVDGYILPTQATGTIQLFRLNFAYIPTLHHWTIDAYEYSQLICCYGWSGEGGAGFVIP